MAGRVKIFNLAKCCRQSSLKPRLAITLTALLCNRKLILEEKISSSSPSGFYIHERLSIRERPRQELRIALTDHFFARGSSPVRTEEKNLNFNFFFFGAKKDLDWRTSLLMRAA
jgi:hypothetical protein